MTVSLKSQLIAIKIQHSKELLAKLKKREEYLNALELVLAVEIAHFFKKLENEILSLIDENEIFNITTNNLAEEIIASHFEEYYDIILNYNIKAYDNGSEYVSSITKIRKNESIISKAIKSITFNVSELFGYSENIYSNLRNQTFQGSTKTMERANTNINNVISEGYKEGLGNKEIGKNIQNEFKGLKSWEAERIATTEVNGAQSLGAYEQYFENNTEYHQWLGAGDDRMRNTHRELDGEIVKVGTPFSNGLLHPGDRNGPIKEWIYCRCTTVPWICPYNMMVPPGMVRFRESDLITLLDDENINQEIDINKDDYIEYSIDGENSFDGLNRDYKLPKKVSNKELIAGEKYSSVYYDPVNSYNRKVPGYKQILKDYKISEKQVKDINKGLDKLTNRMSIKKDTILYRGEKKLFIKPEVGKTYKFDTFTSTSFDKNIANNFAKEDQVLYKIYAKKGTKGSYLNDISVAPNEQEWLIPKGAKYKVLSYDKKKKIIEIMIL